METGTVLLCKHKLTWKPISWVQWGIRKIVGPYDHSALIVNGMVQESTFKDGIIRMTFEEWLESRPGVKYDIYLHPKHYKIDPVLFNEKCREYLGKKYDKKAILDHLWWAIKKKYFKNNSEWTGSTAAGEADKKYYCAEWMGRLFLFKNWWNITPSNFAELLIAQD